MPEVLLTSREAHPVTDKRAAIQQRENLVHAGELVSQGLAFEFGRGVTQDFEKAVASYQRGAELGLAEAQWHYGRMFDPTENTLWERPTEAIKWDHMPFDDFRHEPVDCDTPRSSA